MIGDFSSLTDITLLTLQEPYEEFAIRIISPATNRANVPCQHRKLSIHFILVYYVRPSPILKVKTDPATFYKYVRSKLTESAGISSLASNGVVITDDQEKAKAFSVQFSSVFTKEKTD